MDDIFISCGKCGSSIKPEDQSCPKCGSQDRNILANDQVTASDGSMDKAADDKQLPKFEKYENVAEYLLNEFASHFGLDRVEGKQKIEGHRSGTEWTIEAKGVKINEEGFVIVECRRYTTSKLKQEALGGLAYRIIDAGAAGGIVVSPMELQAGAKKVAEAEDIIEVQLSPESTRLEYVMRFLNKVMVGVHDQIKITDSVEAVVTRWVDPRSSE